MYIATKLKKESIIEYLLYMWQIEDLIRAFRFDIDKINEAVIVPYELSDDEKKTLYEWYESLIDMMRREDVQQKDHIQLNRNVIIELNEFHSDLMRSGLEAAYNAQYNALLPSFAQLRQKQSQADISDIELGVNFLYGVMLLNMKKAEISEDTRKTQADVSRFLALLNHHHLRYLKGELRFNQD